MSSNYNSATTTALANTHIANATAAFNNYISEIGKLNTRLAAVMTDMSAAQNNFVGDASNGYQTFYTTYVVPAITTNLIDGENCLTAGAISMLKLIEDTLLKTTDPELGNFNQNPGAAAEGAE